MTHQCLLRRGIPIAMWLSSINNPAHLLLLLLSQFNIPRCPVLLEPRGLGCTWNGNHSLGSNPGKCNLADSAAFLRRELPDLLNNCLVFVEVFALEFRNCGVSVSTNHWRPEAKLSNHGQDSPIRRKSSGAKSSGDW